jgi:hypothetical protein
MAQNIKLIVYPVKDVEKAKAFFSKFLDAEPYVASPYYVGYKVGNLEVGLDPNLKRDLLLTLISRILKAVFKQCLRSAPKLYKMLRK